VLWAWFELPFAVHGFGYPLGPDGPVYLWWTRLAGNDGLSAVPRPGVPAVALVVRGATQLPLTAVIAGLEISLSVALGLSCWAIARAGGGARWVAAVAALLGGTFAVHLAAGYLATLAFAVPFAASLLALARPTRRATIAAALLLAAATMSHPLFAILGLAILAAAAALSWREARDEAVRIAVGVGAAAAVVTVALLALAAGPPPLHVDTSRDGFLRRAGLGDVLRSAYLDRFVHRWTRYVEWFSVPLAALGWPRTGGFVRRALGAWALVTVAGVGVSVATGWFPADRFITFGFSIPVLAGFGLERLSTWLGERRRVLAASAGAILVVSMLAGAWIAWARQEPFVEDREVEQLTAVNAIASTAPPGTPLVFYVNDREPSLSFLATRAGNVIRAAMPPARIRDVVVLVPHRFDAGPERARLGVVTSRDVRVAEREHHGSGSLWFLLSSFDPVDRRRSWTRVAPGVALGDDATPPPVRLGGTATDPLVPASAWQIALVSVIALIAFGVGGYGWARAAGLARGADAAAVGPALGWAAFVVLAIALERGGLRPTGTAAAVVDSALAIGGGFALRAILERRAGAHAPDEVGD
jgi:hypothetical protein